MATRKAEVTIRVVGSKEAMKALRGVRDEGRRSTRESRRNQQEQTRDEEREVGKRKRARRRAEQESLTEAQRAARTRKLIERDVTREVENQARARARAEREAARRGGMAGAIFRGAGRAALGGAAIANAAVGRVQGMQGALGISSQEQRVQSFIQMQQNFIRLAAQGGLSAPRREELWTQIGQTARSTNADPSDIIGALEMAQNRFSDLEGFASNIEEIARVAQATGAPMEHWVGAIGEFQRQMGVTSAEIPDLIGIVTQAARDGSIEAGDIAANFAGIMSTFSTLRGGKGGIDQAREFMGLSEVMGAGGRSSEETRTLVTNLMSILSRGKVQAGIERTTGRRDLFDDRGVMQVSFAELFSVMNSARGDAFRSPAALERMDIKDVQARDAILAVLNQFERGNDANPITAIANASSEEGRKVIDETMSALMSSASGRALGVDIGARVDTMQNGDEVVSTMTSLVRPLTELQAQYPLLTESMGFLKDAATQAGITLAALNFLGLGGGSASAAAASAPGLGAGAGAGALSLAGGGILAGAAVAARGGYELSEGMTGSGSMFAGGLPGMRRTLERERERGGDEAVRERIRRDTAFMNEGILGIASRMTGADRVLRVMLEPESRQALASDVARASGEQSARTAGGPARRGGG